MNNLEKWKSRSKSNSIKTLSHIIDICIRKWIHDLISLIMYSKVLMWFSFLLLIKSQWSKEKKRTHKFYFVLARWTKDIYFVFWNLSNEKKTFLFFFNQSINHWCVQQLTWKNSSRIDFLSLLSKYTVVEIGSESCNRDKTWKWLDAFSSDFFSAR